MVSAPAVKRRRATKGDNPSLVKLPRNGDNVAPQGGPIAFATEDSHGGDIRVESGEDCEDLNTLQGWQPKEFFRGAIVRIKMVDFMTFDECEIFPGPRLNLVLGPNGSGKSAIVCALALGLGGNTNVLDRVRTLGGFIKTGRAKATIEIELFEKNASNVIVRREIALKVADEPANQLRTSKNSVSTFFINDEIIGEKDFRRRMKDSFAIQVDNLCQFLPQDKVVGFSRLSEEKLLIETIRAGLGERFVDEQQHLAELKKSIDEMDSVTLQRRKKLGEMKIELQRLEKDLENIRNREALEKQVAWHRAQIAYKKLNSARNEYLNLKKSTAKLLEKKKQLAQRKEGIMEELASQRKLIQENSSSHGDIKHHRDMLVQFQAAHKDFAQKWKERVEEIEKRVDEIGSYHEQKREREQQLLSSREAVRKHEAALERFVEENGVLEVIETRRQKQKGCLIEATNVLEKVKRREEQILGKINSDERALRMHKSRLEAIEQRCNRAEERLGKLRFGLAEKMKLQWRQVKEWKSKKLISENVYLIALEVSAAKPLIAVYCEKAITGRQMCTFVTTNKSDRDFIMDKPGFNVMNIEGGRVETLKRFVNQDVLDQLSLGYLDDLISCNDAVKQALRNICGIDRVLCSEEDISKRFGQCSDDFLYSNLPNIRIFTPQARYSVKKSRFRNSPIIETEHWNASKIHSRIFDARGSDAEASSVRKIQADVDELNRSLSTFRIEKQQVDQESRAATESVAVMRKKVEECSTLQEAFLRIQESLKRAKETMRERENDTTRDDFSGIDRSVKAIGKQLKSIAVQSEGLAPLALTSTASLRSSLLSRAKRANQRVALSSLETDNEMIELELKDASLKHENEAKSMAAKKKEARERIVEYKAADPEEDPSKRLVQEEAIDAQEDLEAALKLLIYKLKSSSADLSSIDRFNNIKKEYEEVNASILKSDEDLLNQRSAFKERRDVWLGEVERLMLKIRESFRTSFEIVQKTGFECRGEVELKYPDGENDDLKDVLKLGVRILVAFRKGQSLCSLNSSVQSGGERSLSTFIYLLSMNDVSHVPFRVVDEINQGMDDTKERICFSLLAANSCGETTLDSEHLERVQRLRAQYFLVTPKLLTGLTYHPDMTFHILFNGPGALPQADCRMKDFLSSVGLRD